MATYAKHARSSQRSSFQNASPPALVIRINAPISVFNTQLFDEAGKMSKVQAEDRNVLASGIDARTSRNSRRSREHNNAEPGKVHSGHQRSATMSITSGRDGYIVQTAEKTREVQSISEQLPNRYTRPVGPELVSSKVPSCIGLPPSWTCIHDRFIAYLATHAPLDRNGKVPRHEERRERWRTEDIVRLVSERFPHLGPSIKANMIEKRLALLDLAGDNDYFKIPYGAYVYEEWGQGI